MTVGTGGSGSLTLPNTYFASKSSTEDTAESELSSLNEPFSSSGDWGWEGEACEGAN